MRLIDRIRKTDPAVERAMVVQQSWGVHPNTERIGADFISWSVDGYGGNGIVFAVLNARLNLFTEARFKWRNLADKRPALNPNETEIGVGSADGNAYGRYFSVSASYEF